MRIGNNCEYFLFQSIIDFKKDAYVYYLRAMIYIEMDDKKAASKDIYTSFQLTDDEELEKELKEMWKYCGN